MRISGFGEGGRKWRTIDRAKPRKFINFHLCNFDTDDPCAHQRSRVALPSIRSMGQFAMCFQCAHITARLSNGFSDPAGKLPVYCADHLCIKRSYDRCTKPVRLCLRSVACLTQTACPREAVTSSCHVTTLIKAARYRNDGIGELRLVACRYLWCEQF